MNRRNLAIASLLAVCLMLFFSKWCVATTIPTFTADIDGEILNDAGSYSKRYSVAQVTSQWYPPSNRIVRGLVQWDIGSIPSDATILDVDFWYYPGTVQLNPINIRHMSNPLSAAASTLYDDAGDGTIYWSGTLDQFNPQWIDLGDNANTALQSQRQNGKTWFAIGFHLQTESGSTKQESIVSIEGGNPAKLRVEYEVPPPQPPPPEEKVINLISLVGKLTDTNDMPVSKASFQIHIKNVTDDSTVWGPYDQNDVVSNGLFNLLLGSQTGQTLELVASEKYKMVIAIDVDSDTFSEVDVGFGDESPAEDIIEFFA